MYTIGRLAKRFGLSRSTLLYYDRIGLLRPSGRAANGYRWYTQNDAARLEQVNVHRKAGLKLSDIRRILDTGGGPVAGILENRLSELNSEIETLREQQRFIVSLLKEPEILAARSQSMDKKQWTELLASAGFSTEDMLHWHVEFERRSPQKHQRFLELLGMPAGEITALRSWSRRPFHP